MRNPKNPTIYLVEDDPALNKLLVMHLQKSGYTRVTGFLSGEECLKNLNPAPDIIIQDYELPGMNGVSVLKSVKANFPKTEFIFLSGQPSIEVAVDAMNYGAYDYIVKDTVAKDKLIFKLKKLISIYQLKKEKKLNKIGIFIFAGLLVLSWIIFSII